MKAFILAGGFATRLWPLTEHRAKPMLLVDGQPILGHILNQIPPEVDIYLLTNSRFEADFRTYLNSEHRKVEIFCEDTHCDADKLGALAAVATAIEHYNIEDDLLVLAGDNLLPDLDLRLLFPAAGSAHLALKTVETLDEARSFGVVEFEDGSSTETLKPVKSFVEKPETPNSTAVSTGFMGISKDLLPDLIAYSKKSPDALGAIITEFIAHKHPVAGLLVKGNWFDVGSYEAYLDAHKTLQTESVKIHKTALVENCTFEGKVYIGAKAQVKNSVLIDTVIYPRTKLENCHISQCVIDSDSDFKGVDLGRKLVRQGTIVYSENQ